MGEKFRDRFKSLLDTVSDYNAEGLIFQRIKFCQLWGAEYHNLLEACREVKIPLLSLEREYGVISTGQIKTRVQAFLEKIEGGRAKVPD
jgi:benzoyl-CoA reductase/2-hydroxyglutaryl-CoA dehydratase subunit BcrC/BadD/HgdB